MLKVDAAYGRYKPLDGWMYSGHYMKSRLYYECEVILPETIFVSLDSVFAIHEAPALPLKSLDQSWEDTKSYIISACKLLGRAGPGRLSSCDRRKLLKALGEPPGPAWPFYFLSAGDGVHEKVVYIGKTDARTHRFSNGHRAITGLHRPEFEGLSKKLYLATVTIYSDDGRAVPLEWLHPRRLRAAILADIEAQLVYAYQPALNTGLKCADHSVRPVPIIVERYVGCGGSIEKGVDPHRVVDSTEWDCLFDN